MFNGSITIKELAEILHSVSLALRGKLPEPIVRELHGDEARRLWLEAYLQQDTEYERLEETPPPG